MQFVNRENLYQFIYMWSASPTPWGEKPRTFLIGGTNGHDCKKPETVKTFKKNHAKKSGFFTDFFRIYAG